MATVTLPALFLSVLLAGCGPMDADDGEVSSDLSRVPEKVRVNGVTYDVEDVYLPRVVQCENPGAPAESLKAQAIAARTYLTYRTRGLRTPTIRDGQSDQVFTCAANKNGKYVPDEVKAAVAATRGKVVLHRGAIIAGFFVAGATRTSGCARISDPTTTERYVTVNVGLSGSKVHASTIGNRSDPANRGAMGQNLANCLARRDGLSAGQLLAYFYGADIEVRGDDAVPVAPTPLENDPAAAPPPVEPTDPTEPTDPMDPSPAPEPTPTNTDPSQPQPDSCWSYTLQRWTTAGECVQSMTDARWYQCDATAGFLGPVDETTASGPVGTCTSWNPL